MARARIRATVRADALRGVLDWPADRLHRTAVGDVMARVIGDVEVLGTGIGEIIVETWDTLLFSASLVVAMCLYDVRLAGWALLPVPVALLLAKASGRWVTRTDAGGAAGERGADRLHLRAPGRAADHPGVRPIRRDDRRVGRLADAQADAELSATRLNAWLQPVYATLTTAGVVAVVWLGGDRVAAGAMSVGALVAFLQLFVRFTARAYRIPQMANRVQAGRAAYGRLAPLLAPADAGHAAVVVVAGRRDPRPARRRWTRTRMTARPHQPTCSSTGSTSAIPAPREPGAATR